MTLSVTHAFSSGYPDGTDTGKLQPSDWNAAHALTGVASPSQGGTGSAYLSVTGPTAARTFTFPDADGTILASSSVTPNLTSPLSISGGTADYNDYMLTLVAWAGPGGHGSDSGIGLTAAPTSGGSPFVDFIGDNGGKARIGRNPNAAGAALFVGTGGNQANAFQIGSRDATPVQVFTSDACRLYIDPAGNMGVGTLVPAALLSIGGAGSASYTADITGSLHVSGQLLTGNGTVGAPAQAFAIEPSTGLYFIGAQTIGLSIVGTRVVEFGSSYVGIRSNAGQFMIGSTLDVVLSRSAANVLAISGALEGTEMTAPGAGAVNTGRLYFEDNGSGKTRLMCIFNSGAAQQIAIQP